MGRLVASLLLLGCVCVSSLSSAPSSAATQATKATQAAARAGSGLRVGIAYGDTLTWRSDEALDGALDDAVSLGATWVRVDLSWANIQPDDADHYRWALFDRVAQAAVDHGLAVLPILTYTPAWARDDGCEVFTCPPADPAAFATFAGLAAQRYAALGIHTWEIWNEENLPRFWPAPDAGRYATLLAATRDAMLEADSSARLLMGGLAAVPTTESGSIDPRTFVRRVCAAGACDGLRGVAYHPYTFPYLASYDPSWTTVWDVIQDTRPSLRSVLRKAGHPELRVWITEYGAPTGGPGGASDGSPGSIGASTDHVTEDRQRRIAVDGLRTAAATSRVAALFWYTDRDHPARSSPEDFFGLRRADGTRKPAWRGFHRMVLELAGS